MFVGCGQQNDIEDMLDDYSLRVSRVLDIEQPKAMFPAIPAFPPRRARLQPTTEIREGLLDVLKLKHCGLLPMIAERNSSLGKVYTPASRLIYELKFYQGIRSCAQLLQDDPATDRDLIRQVTEILRLKQLNLPPELWNGIYTAAEIEQHFALSAAPLARDNNPSPSAPMQTLLFATQAALNNQQINAELIKQVEAAYAELHQSEAGAQILQSLRLLTAYLNQTANIIELRLAERPLCFQQQPTPQATILRNVFQKYYAAAVQPYMAEVQRHASSWIGTHQQLWQLFENEGVMPENMHNYRALWLGEQGLWRRYEQARNRHTEAWQQILTQCGLMPSR